MTTNQLLPDYLFESSWEVCNKVGGIYTVLSTHTKTLRDLLQDRLIFIGPDCWKQRPCPYFLPDDSLFATWQQQAQEEGLCVRLGRWDIPGKPIAILVDFEPFYAQKNQLYAEFWNLYQVDSLHAYGDYDEASMFSYAAGRVVESFYRSQLNATQRVVYHGHEWMTGLGLLYVRQHVPEIATVFTTHATSIGRSIAGNHKPLYAYLSAYQGDQMSRELNIESKHSVEKQTAHHVDCFTTVSEITASECAELLDKPVDEVLPNGFEDSFVPKGAAFTRQRKAARKRLLQVANALMGHTFGDDTLIVSTSGRYEFRNKGIDVFIDAIQRLRQSQHLLSKDVLAVIAVPGWVREARADLQQRLTEAQFYDTPLSYPMLTHWLHNMEQDAVLTKLAQLGLQNQSNDRVKVMFVPCYLTGDDGILQRTYYDYLLGNDLCAYPSYYEPWGYTPLEAIAFKVPCITTNLAGFGMWAAHEAGTTRLVESGVEVIHRTDDNAADVAQDMANLLLQFANLPTEEVNRIRRKAAALSKKALWSKFIKYYLSAYNKALKKAEERNKIN